MMRDAYTFRELINKLNLPTKEVAKALGELEIFGMIRGQWIQREPDHRWERKYFITGEGTQSFIDHLKLKKLETNVFNQE